MIPVTSDRWFDFLAFTVQVRAMQKKYRATQDPLLRREAERAEDQLDAMATHLLEDLDAEVVDAASPDAVVVEGGGS